MDARMILTMTPQMLVNGLILAVIYGLSASGFSLIFGVMGQVNLAHGAIIMLGGMFVYYSTTYGIPYFIAILGILIIFPFFGVALERTIFRPVRKLWVAGYIASVGVWLVLEGLAYRIFGSMPKGTAFPIPGIVRLPGGAVVPWSKVIVGLMGAFLIWVLLLIVAKTKTGRELRAVAQDVEAAILMGISPDRTNAIGFAIGCSLAGLAGGLMSSIYSLDPGSGLVPLFKSFIIVIVGGLGSIKGAILAALIVGLADSFAGTLIGGSVSHAIGFALMALILILKPEGLMPS